MRDNETGNFRSTLNAAMEDAIRDSAASPLNDWMATAIFNAANAYNRTFALVRNEMSRTHSTELAQPMITNLLFVIELLLKFFIVYRVEEENTARAENLPVNARGHVLPELFDHIDDNYQNRILETYTDKYHEPISKSDFVSAMTSTGESPYARWRYIYEHSDQRAFINIELLSKVLDSLGVTAAGLQQKRKDNS